MARSYKKEPVCTLSKIKYAKKDANRKVRMYLKTKMLSNGNDFKKVFPSWDICDWKSYCSKEEYLEYDFGNEEDWKKSYYRK